MIHISHDKLKEIHRVEKQSNPIKPQGIWTAPSTQWLEFYRKNIGDIKNCRYMYELRLNYTKFSKPDPKKVLRVRSESVFDKFTLKYGVVQKSKNYDTQIYIFINWQEVTKKYGGIEVVPLIKSRMSTMDPDIIKRYNDKFKFAKDTNGINLTFWLWVFDIDSGCVWEPDAVKKIKRIYKI
jgi:hypothetical protein